VSLEHPARVALDQDTIALLAEELADRLEARRAEARRWVGVEAVAAHLDVDASYVYEHAEELAAHRLGTGPKARLRFRLDLVDEALCLRSRRSREPEPAPLSGRARRQRAAKGTSAPLLPIRGAGGTR
jgi:hypothetical protein